MKCTNCGADLPNDALFCGECGASVPQQTAGVNTYSAEPSYAYGSNMITCPRCGKNVEGDKPFCPNCGNRLSPYSAPARRAPEPKNSNALLIVLVIIIGVLVLVAATLITFFALNGGKSDNASSPSPSPIVTASPSPTPTPTPQPTAAPAVPTVPPATPPAAPQQNTALPTNGFIFPSDSVYISDADLAGRSRDEVRLMINEIYARHGYIFSTQSYQDYFSSKSWYVPVTTSQQDVERRFNAIELANKNFLSNYEKQRGWR